MSIAQVEISETRTPTLAPDRRTAPLLKMEGYTNRDRTGTKIAVRGYLIKVYNAGYRYDLLDAETGKNVELYP